MTDTGQSRIRFGLTPIEKMYTGSTLNRQVLHSEIKRVLGSRLKKQLALIDDFSWVSFEDVTTLTLALSSIGTLVYPSNGTFDSDITGWTANINPPYTFAWSNVSYGASAGALKVEDTITSSISSWPVFHPTASGTWGDDSYNVKFYLGAGNLGGNLKCIFYFTETLQAAPPRVTSTLVDNIGNVSLEANGFSALVNKQSIDVTFTFPAGFKGYPVWQLGNFTVGSSYLIRIYLDDVSIEVPSTLSKPQGSYYDGLNLSGSPVSDADFLYVEITEALGTATPSVIVSLDASTNWAQLTGVGDFCILPVNGINVSSKLMFKYIGADAQARLKWMVGRYA